MLEVLHGALLLEAQNNVSKAVQLILSISPTRVPLSFASQQIPLLKSPTPYS
jgi:hypothetical protein